MGPHDGELPVKSCWGPQLWTLSTVQLLREEEEGERGEEEEERREGEGEEGEGDGGGSASRGVYATEGQ